MKNLPPPPKKLTQHPLQHPSPNFIMLHIRLPRLDSNRPRAEEIDILHFGVVGGGEGGRGDGGEALLELGADAAAEEGAGEVASVD